MKILITLLLTLVFSQAMSAIPHENLDPFAARTLCYSETYAQDFDLGSENIACNGNATLYYQFRTAGELNGLQIATFTSSASSTFKLYGPFETVQEGALQILQLTAPTATSGSTATSHVITMNSKANKVYILGVMVQSCSGSLAFSLDPKSLNCTQAIDCQNCIPQFNPGPGKYVLSAWVKEEGALPTKTSYDRPSIEITYPSAPLVTHTFTPAGQIIDGWQRIESIFEIPAGATGLKLKLKVATGNAFFDDIRVFPFDGSMISYVYDPVTLRLVAELDERNYAKIYEYDEEGKLTRIKKETEKGIMTIQENRENSVKD